MEKYEKASMEVVDLMDDPITTTVITSCAGGILGFDSNPCDSSCSSDWGR